MAEPTQPTDTDELERSATREAPDVIALLVGLVSLVTATFSIIGYTPEPPSFDPRWLIAGGAAVVGLILLVSSVRGSRSRSD